MQRARKETKKLRTYLGRVLRNVERLCGPLKERQASEFERPVSLSSRLALSPQKDRAIRLDRIAIKEFESLKLGRNAYSCALLRQLRGGSMIDLNRLFNGGLYIVRCNQEVVLNEPSLNFIPGFQPLTMGVEKPPLGVAFF